MPIFNKPLRYHSYLLRFWEDRSQSAADPAVWRFSLEDPRTGERQGFATVQALLTFLLSQTDTDELHKPRLSQ
jgi:hypothetical protein